jgi:hypothetical protein
MDKFGDRVYVALQQVNRDILLYHIFTHYAEHRNAMSFMMSYNVQRSSAWCDN